MKKEQLYFKSTGDTICYELEDILPDLIDEAKEEDEETVTLVKAIPDNHNKEFIWCTFDGEAIERRHCKKSMCNSYSSVSGRGKCKHRGNLYQHGEEVTFNVGDY